MTIIHRRLRRAAAVVALLPLTLAAGCMSAGKRYEQGLTLENRGQPAEAARRYVDALRRDPSLVDARARLAESGRLAIDQYLGQARAESDAGAHDDAAEVLLELDALRRSTAGVGVELAVPADYATYRRRVLDLAIEQSLDDGAALAEGGRWSEALGRLERTGRWQPAAEQRRAADEARLNVYSDWMSAEGAAGRHRAAWEVGERAVSALGRQFPGMERIVEAQQFAIDEGTLRVAVLPIGTTRAAGDALPASFLRDVETELEAGAWTRPPMFVEVMDPRDVRREARRYDGSDLESISPATRVGRALGADLAVLVRIDSVGVREADVRSERRTVRTREGADTAWAVRSGRRQAWAQVRFVVVEVASGRILTRDGVTADASRNFREGAFTGDWRQLLLNEDDRRLFNAAERDDARGDLMRELSRAVAADLPGTLYDRVQRQVR